MIYAYTGSRSIADEDRNRIARIIDPLPEGTLIVTGGCVGVDAFVAEYAHAHGFNVHTVLPANHSRVDPNWRHRCHSYEQMPGGTRYRDRNLRMIEIASCVIGLPAYPEKHPKSRRSGTWQTIRLAQQANKLAFVHILRVEEALP